MKTGLFVPLASMMVVAGVASAASVDTRSAESGCWSVYDDIWEERRSEIPQREIDGGQIESLSDFVQLTGGGEQAVAIIKGGDFSGWDFTEMPLSNICFEESGLAGAIFTDVTATGTGFINTDLTDADMSGANMPQILFRNAGLKNLKAKGANFSDGHFDGGWFEGNVEGWNIDGADMTGFTFDCGITLSDGCPVYQGGDPVSAKGTNFARAVLHGFGLYNVDLTGAILDDTIIGPAQLPQLREATMAGPIILRGGESDIAISVEEARILLSEHSDAGARKSDPSFDCARAGTKVEKAICGEYASDLRLMDQDVATLYKRARVVDPGISASQRNWLRRRDRCGAEAYPVDCLRQSYSERKGTLLGKLGESNWLTPGEAALFIDDLLPLSAQFAQSALSAKIAPVLAGASMTEILIERGSNGLYSIKGHATGANAHLCSIAASHLYLDRETGWYIPVSEGPAIPIFRIFDNRLEIFANGRPDYEKYPGAADFMSCGMRASLGETIRIDVGDELIESHRKSLNEEM